MSIVPPTTSAAPTVVVTSSDDPSISASSSTPGASRPSLPGSEAPPSSSVRAHPPRLASVLSHQGSSRAFAIFVAEQQNSTYPSAFSRDSTGGGGVASVAASFGLDPSDTDRMVVGSNAFAPGAEWHNNGIPGMLVGCGKVGCVDVEFYYAASQWQAQARRIEGDAIMMRQAKNATLKVPTTPTAKAGTATSSSSPSDLLLTHLSTAADICQRYLLRPSQSSPPPPGKEYPKLHIDVTQDVVEATSKQIMEAQAKRTSLPASLFQEYTHLVYAYLQSTYYSLFLNTLAFDHLEVEALLLGEEESQKFFKSAHNCYKEEYVLFYLDYERCRALIQEGPAPGEVIPQPGANVGSELGVTASGGSPSIGAAPAPSSPSFSGTSGLSTGGAPSSSSSSSSAGTGAGGVSARPWFDKVIAMLDAMYAVYFHSRAEYAIYIEPEIRLALTESLKLTKRTGIVDLSLLNTLLTIKDYTVEVLKYDVLPNYYIDAKVGHRRQRRASLLAEAAGRAALLNGDQNGTAAGAAAAAAATPTNKGRRASTAMSGPMMPPIMATPVPPPQTATNPPQSAASAAHPIKPLLQVDEVAMLRKPSTEPNASPRKPSSDSSGGGSLTPRKVSDPAVRKGSDSSSRKASSDAAGGQRKASDSSTRKVSDPAGRKGSDTDSRSHDAHSSLDGGASGGELDFDTVRPPGRRVSIANAAVDVPLGVRRASATHRPSYLLNTTKSSSDAAAANGSGASDGGANGSSAASSSSSSTALPASSLGESRDDVDSASLRLGPLPSSDPRARSFSDLRARRSVISTTAGAAAGGLPLAGGSGISSFSMGVNLGRSPSSPSGAAGGVPGAGAGGDESDSDDENEGMTLALDASLPGGGGAKGSANQEAQFEKFTQKAQALLASAGSTPASSPKAASSPSSQKGSAAASTAAIPEVEMVSTSSPSAPTGGLLASPSPFASIRRRSVLAEVPSSLLGGGRGQAAATAGNSEQSSSGINREDLTVRFALQLEAKETPSPNGGGLRRIDGSHPPSSQQQRGSTISSGGSGGKPLRSILKTKLRSETMSEMLRRIFLERLGESSLHLKALQAGCLILKYNAAGKAAERWFKVSVDGTELCWGKVDEKTKAPLKAGIFNRKKRFPLADVTRIRYGSSNSKRFAKYNLSAKSMPWMAWSVYFPEKTLDLVCKSERDVHTWFQGIQALAPLSTGYLSKACVIWRRVQMKIRYYSMWQNIEPLLFVEDLLAAARQDVPLARLPSTPVVDLLNTQIAATPEENTSEKPKKK